RLYERSLDLLQADSKEGLRLELTLDPLDPDLAALQAFPWELMRQPGTPKFLILSRRSPVTRFLTVPQPVYAAPLPHPLHMPAVIAMQHSISDEAAITFSRTFYQHLAAGDPVDAAVTEGRKAVHSANPAGMEWATPVLFMRTPTGELYPEEDLWDPSATRKR